MMRINRSKKFFIKNAFGILFILGTATLTSCFEGNTKENENLNKPLALPVFTVDTSDATTIKNYLGTIEGKVNVEIRPQAEGILQEIYVDEGSFVEKRSEEHTSELQSRENLVCRLLLEKKKMRAHLEGVQ